MHLYLNRRGNAIRRAESLFQEVLSSDYTAPNARQRSQLLKPTGKLKRLIYEAGYNISSLPVILASIFFALLGAALSSLLISAYAVWIYAALGAVLPVIWLNGKAQSRAAKFSEDYPTVLLAMASSLKVGHTPVDALQRATQLLPKTSPVRIEVTGLIEQLHAGYPKQQVIANFADSYRLPDLELFRTAFAIVLENGGHFAHTLQRLSDVSRDRSTLIKAAGVTTVTMRMTANFLLAIAPLLLTIIAMRSDDFWQVITANPTANNVATAGVLLITASYILLRKMSAFKP